MIMDKFHFVIFEILKNWSAWFHTALLLLKLQCANNIAGREFYKNLEKKNSVDIANALTLEEFEVKVPKNNSPIWMIRIIPTLLSFSNEL